MSKGNVRLLTNQPFRVMQCLNNYAALSSVKTITNITGLKQCNIIKEVCV